MPTDEENRAAIARLLAEAGLIRKTSFGYGKRPARRRPHSAALMAAAERRLAELEGITGQSAAEAAAPAAAAVEAPSGLAQIREMQAEMEQALLEAAVVVEDTQRFLAARGVK